MTPGLYRWPDPTQAPVLHLSGELDIHTSAGVSRQLRDHAETHAGSVLVIDLTEVSFMDSAGLDTISKAYDALAEDDRLLVAECLTPAVRRFFQVVNAFRRVPLVHETLTTGSDQPDPQDDPPSRTAELQSLSALVESIRAAVTESAEIEQAKGLLMGVHGCDANQAAMLLALIARRRHVTVHDIAVGRLTALADAHATASPVTDIAAGAMSRDAGL